MYSLVYSCQIVNGYKFENAWILSRLKEYVASGLKENLAAYGVDIGKFVLTDQTNCPWFVLDMNKHEKMNQKTNLLFI